MQTYDPTTFVLNRPLLKYNLHVRLRQGDRRGRRKVRRERWSRMGDADLRCCGTSGGQLRGGRDLCDGTRWKRIRLEMDFVRASFRVVAGILWPLNILMDQRVLYINISFSIGGRYFWDGYRSRMFSRHLDRISKVPRCGLVERRLHVRLP